MIHVLPPLFAIERLSEKGIEPWYGFALASGWICPRNTMPTLAWYLH
jgi:hypothetical protein